MAGIKGGIALIISGGLMLGALAGAPAWAEQAGPKVGIEAIDSKDSPVVEIARRSRPAVVQVINVFETWDPASRQLITRDQVFGSGVYIDGRGYVVTNYHVVENASQIDVCLEDGSRFPVKLAGADSETDLALLQLDAPLDCDPVPMGDSSALQVGELAVAIGNPAAASHTLNGTVTVGIISAAGPQEVNVGNFRRRVEVVQTDAALNYGSSGGALLNAQGELVGIPTLEMTGNYVGFSDELSGFAIPVDIVKPVVAQLIEHGKVLRPRMGVTIIGDFNGPDEPVGGYPPAGPQVGAVETGGPAHQAGIQAYDIITHVDGVRVKTYSAMSNELNKKQAGEAVSLSLYRAFDPVSGNRLSKGQALEVSLELKILDE